MARFCQDHRTTYPNQCKLTLMTNPRGSRISNLLSQPRFVQFWLLPVWIMLGIARLLIMTICFRHLAPRLGRQCANSPWLPLLSPAQEGRAWLIGRVIGLAAKYTPWESNCFPQAVVARILLGLHGLPYILYLGLMHDPADSKQMKAHAWVVAGRVRVTGGVSFGRFTVVGCFVSPRLAEGPAL